jgi:hypothetical protein
MKQLKPFLNLARDARLRLWARACVAGHRHGALLLALPVCSSACFFLVRFALSVLNLSA